MHLDWYDRQILTFVLGWAPNSEPSDEEAFLQFGIDARRVMRRFDAIVDVFTSSQVPLEEPDLNLVRRAAGFRSTGLLLIATEYGSGPTAQRRVRCSNDHPDRTIANGAQTASGPL
jgi:hypothetical protein